MQLEEEMGSFLLHPAITFRENETIKICGPYPFVTAIA